MKFKISIFFLFFTLSTKNLFLLDLNLGVNFLNYDNFKCGCLLGVKIFDEKLGFQKKLGSVGIFIDVIEVYSIDSFYVTSNILFEVGELQKISYMGVNCSCSFRPWTWPINVGISFNYLKFRPKLSFGIIICFNYHYQRLNINLGTGLLYTKTKNVNGLFNDSIPSDSCINSLNKDLIITIRNNKEKLLDNDEYFFYYNEILECEKKLNEIVEEIEKLVFLNETIDFKSLKFYSELTRSFDKTIKKLEKSLKKTFKIFKENGLKIKYFSSDNVKTLNRFIIKVNAQIQNDEDEYENFVNRLDDLQEEDDYKEYYPEFRIVQYLKNRILKVFFNFAYFIEIKDKDLGDTEYEEEREQLLNS